MRMTEELFLEVYEKHKNTVYSVIFNYVKNTDDTADLHQDVFISLLHQDVFISLLHQDGEFESEEHIKSWLIRVAANKCKNFLRSRKHIADEPISEQIPYFQKQKDTELLKMVLQLPEKYRIPIHLFYYEDYSIKQIADVLDIPEATVKIRLKRGRDKLSKTLRKEEWL